MSTQDILRDMVATMGFEAIPFKNVEHKVTDQVARTVPISVTTTAGHGVDRTLDVALHLTEQGFDAAPHLAARLFRDDEHVAQVVDRLVTGGVERIFVIGGDLAEPTGAFTDAHALLESIARTGHRFREVGIGGYPEGHPNFTDETADRAVVAKAPYADRVITQMCFDASITTSWAARQRAHGVGLTIHAGIAGPVNRQKLIRISAQLGLGASARFLQKQRGLWRFVLPGAFNPTRGLKKLAAAQPVDRPLVTGIHVFTFNEFAASEQWRLRLRRQVGLD